VIEPHLGDALIVASKAERLSSETLRQTLLQWNYPLVRPERCPLLLQDDTFRLRFEQDLIPFYDSFSRDLFSRSFAGEPHDDFDAFTQPLGGRCLCV
jgi:hypothetical protein